jgi:hypothetical protein
LGAVVELAVAVAIGAAEFFDAAGGIFVEGEFSIAIGIELVEVPAALLQILRLGDAAVIILVGTGKALVFLAF